MAASRALAAALLRSSARSSLAGFRSSSSLASNDTPGSGFALSRLLSSALSRVSTSHADGLSLMKLPRQPVLVPALGGVRHYAKRAKKWQGAPYAMLPVPPEGEEIPDSRPNQGSVRNRNHQKRMAQRAEFAKMQAHTRREQKRIAITARDTARRKRWKEGAERSKAWAQVCADRAAKEVPLAV
ncbi:uncharacterized protein [Physcomitrium patens]|uniref:Uncharacterized protein n=1 Tax=Physcomitrium patens TaxID=3218 RepID=A0A2K1JUL7_PHYPA|nr:uncharacterized protein LOC112288292 isoform X1 [Physcomitrium patens]PNR45206.1 hypothetical protein PHYPA_014977 [Physcomitrium patens]|eukprot:XP_024388117.1 uncharacterized protein LOC112288292 isoform X1 [Physcomitrella patens]